MLTSVAMNSWLRSQVVETNRILLVKVSAIAWLCTSWSLSYSPICGKLSAFLFEALRQLMGLIQCQHSCTSFSFYQYLHMERRWRQQSKKKLASTVIHRGDAVNSMAYKANTRIRDLIYGCIGAISYLQWQAKQLRTQLAVSQAEMVEGAYSDVLDQIFPVD